MIATPSPAIQVLNREFYEMRCKILELAAAFDRLDRGADLDRAAEPVQGDPRLGKIREALGILSDVSKDRAERVQLVFSRPYDDDWQRELGLNVPR